MENETPNPRSRKRAAIGVCLAVILVLAYKGWKYYLRNWLGVDPTEDYVLYETYATIFRVINSVLGVAIYLWVYPKPIKLFRRQSLTPFLIVMLFPILFFVLKASLIGWPIFVSRAFAREIPVNFFTGVSEEFIFRGLMLAGLCCFIGFGKATVISSAIFMAFHLDVTQDYFNLAAIFTASLMFSLGYKAGVTLVSLSLIHFIYDQIHYGFFLAAYGSRNYDSLVIAMNIMLCLGLYFWCRKLGKLAAH